MNARGEFPPLPYKAVKKNTENMFLYYMKNSIQFQSAFLRVHCMRLIINRRFNDDRASR